MYATRQLAAVKTVHAMATGPAAAPVKPAPAPAGPRHWRRPQTGNPTLNNICRAPTLLPADYPPWMCSGSTVM